MTAVLKQRIDEFAGKMAENAPPAALEAIGAEIQKISNNGIASKARKRGDKGVAFSLPNEHGENVSLADLLKEGPVVLKFNRGNWCPFDNLEQQTLEERVDEIRALGARLVVVMPQLPEKTIAARAENKTTFQVLHDGGGSVASKYGLSFALSEDLRPIHLDFGMNVPEYNGDESWVLPVPATYVISPAGEIVYSFVDPNWMSRAEPDEVIDALRKLKA